MRVIGDRCDGMRYIAGYSSKSYDIDITRFRVFEGKLKKTDQGSQSYQGKGISESLPNIIGGKCLAKGKAAYLRDADVKAYFRVFRIDT